VAAFALGGKKILHGVQNLDAKTLSNVLQTFSKLQKNTKYNKKWK
jgi:hypothetical protein